MKRRKGITVLGSTGSVGRNTLDVIAERPRDFSVVALATHGNIDLLEKQARLFKPEILAVYDGEKGAELRTRVSDIPVVTGQEGLEEVAVHPGSDLVVSALVGAIGVKPLFLAVSSGKSVAPANKEALVVAGELIMQEAALRGVDVIPIDSEHSGVYQCLRGEERSQVARVILTASGGPFWKLSKEELRGVTKEVALIHPNWKMGPKITVDSSTFMNKGLEVIEAHYLFGIPCDRIDVVVHPQSMVHAFVEFVDGSLMAQVAEPDMRIPIRFALDYPHRVRRKGSSFCFAKGVRWEFYPPDHERFPCLSFAYEALRTGRSMPCYMNAANEVLVGRFLRGTVTWQEIGRKLERLMSEHDTVSVADLETLFAVDARARAEALRI
ncbi:MAG: 1-deoxy-D-xylulose-5-phosphate reductoisomerase [Simkaniaceae bacterium]|nr:1-deoxy-D-xylulose-5-phosphate reductoisomerase [Simkaniaceae bacterium]